MRWKRITYGIPDVSGDDRGKYSNKTTLVLGGGHSAINVVLDLMKVKGASPETEIIWGLRRNTIKKLLGGALNSELPARAALGAAAQSAIEEGDLKLLVPMSVQQIAPYGDRLQVELTVDGEDTTVVVDEIVVTAGFRPNLDMLRELRLDVDNVVEAPSRLAPLIDPNIHSCGSVKPHGVNELSHPDKNFFIVGMKSYGRAPTFLMRTGYAQVKSIANELAGRFDAARQIEVDLPSAMVCGTTSKEGAKIPSL